MNDRIKDGGPAFPRAGYEGPFTSSSPKNGMSMRDWFAGQALAGMMANCGRDGGNGWTGFEDVAADMAYRTADAMLAVRSGGEAR